MGMKDDKGKDIIYQYLSRDVNIDNVDLINELKRYKNSNTLYNVPKCEEYKLLDKKYAACSKAKNNYHLSTYLGDAKKLAGEPTYVCHKDIFNCIEYNDKKQNIYCRRCKPKFYASSSGLDCLPMQEECAKEKDNDCIECIKKFHLSNNKVEGEPTDCIQDIEKCNKYIDKDKVCGQCDPG
jgi:hypothetical protein